MRWKDFLTTEYKKLDITLEKRSDVQFLSLLHDAYFDPAEIRYAKNLIISRNSFITPHPFTDIDPNRSRIDCR